MKLIASFLCLTFVSCSGIIGGLTNTPTPSIPVARVDGTGKPVNIASRDLALAELGAPSVVHGLYDTGVVAGIVAKVREQKSFSGGEITIKWEGTPNPLNVPWDTERTDWHPASMGRFGPFGGMWGRTY